MWLRLWLFGKKLGCHQLPERSFFWHGRQFPVCARCTGVYLGELLALPLHFAAGSCWRLDLAFCLLMLLDWSIQFFAIRRSTNLSRQSHIIAANVDRAYIVVTVDFPEVKLPFLDRLLVTCEVYNVPATIVLNKCDLYGEAHEDRVHAFHAIYEGAGYPVMDVSAMTGMGIDALRDACKGSVSLFSGVSGVGKSSLIKALDPSLDPKVGEISDAHLQGKHTTTFYEMYRLASGGSIIDTPGIRGFGLVDLGREEIALYFPEMLKASENCRFTPCTHTHEPGCAVKAAVEEGTISYERYSSYLGMLEDETKYR